MISDTDHLWGVGGDATWVWKSFLRGLHPIYMDPLDKDPRHEAPRKAMGHTLRFAQKLNLARSIPNLEVSSTRYCLANPGREYLVYQPDGGKPFTVQITQSSYRGEWFNTISGEAGESFALKASEAKVELKAPFDAPAVLLLQRQE